MKKGRKSISGREAAQEKEWWLLEGAEEGKVCSEQRGPGEHGGRCSLTRRRAFRKNGKSLYSFKQRSDMIRFIGIKDHSSFPWVNRFERKTRMNAER